MTGDVMGDGIKETHIEKGSGSRGEWALIMQGAPTRDPWSEGLPKVLDWVLTVLTFGLWRLFSRQPARMWVPALLSSSFLFLSFAGWDLWPLGFAFVVPMFAVLDQCRSRKQALMWSWLIGWCMNFGGFYWVTGLLMDFAQMPFLVGLAVALLLCAAQGFAIGVFGLLAFSLRSRTSWSWVWLAPVVWLPVEFLAPYLFPFYLGNSQYLFLPMIQIAEVFGPLGVTCVLFVCNGAIYELFRAQVWDKKTWRREHGDYARLKKRATIAAAVGFSLVVANIVYGVVRIEQVDVQQANAEKLKIGMVEGDIGIFMKEAPEKVANNLIIHQKLSQKLEKEDKVDLIVWPESAYQSPIVYASTLESDDLEALKKTVTEYPRRIPQNATYLYQSDRPLPENDREDQRAGAQPADRFAIQRGFKTPLIFGGISFRVLGEDELKDNPPIKKVNRLIDGKVQRVTRNYRIYNSAFLIDEVGKVKGLYNKTYLLAFGEYIPLARFIPWVYDAIPAASEFTPGNTIEVFPFKGHKLGVMICYEDIIPAFGRKLAKEEPSVIINVTNDAWFGKTHEPYLHLALATFRAVEARKWLLRSTNTGVTAFIDATGKIVNQTSIYDPEVISEDVAMLNHGQTLYVRLGDWLGYLSLFLTFVLLVLVWRERVPGTS